MLRFTIYDGDQPAKTLSLDGAYLIGSDHVPIRAEFEFADGELICHKRAQGPSALNILWPVKGMGSIMLETTRLPERDRPYNLHLELARAQLMRLCQKREDWGLFDIDNIEHIERGFQQSQDLLIESIKSGSMEGAAKIGNDVLRTALPVGEQMCLFHAGMFLTRRRQQGQLGRRLFGCQINPKNKDDLYRKRLINAFDFAYLPTSWRNIEPKQGEFDWDDLDEWFDWLGKHRIPIKAGPLVSFDELRLPDWLYIYEHDFEAIRDFLELGGPVLRIIGVVILFLWILILERLIYYRTGLKSLFEEALNEWERRPERKSWHARQVREAIISRVRISAEKGLPMIQTLVALCPLLGLMGTVTGMIQVFEVMAISGTSNARSMAAGVSRATVPTMAGMVGALSGVFLITILTRTAKRNTAILEDRLTMDH